MRPKKKVNDRTDIFSRLFQFFHFTHRTQVGLTDTLNVRDGQPVEGLWGGAMPLGTPCDQAFLAKMLKLKGPAIHA